MPPFCPGLLLGFGTVNGSVGFYDFLTGNIDINYSVAVDGDILLRIKKLAISENNQFVYLSPYASYIDKWSIENVEKWSGENSSLLSLINKRRFSEKDSKVLDFVLHENLVYIATENGEIKIIDNNLNEVLSSQPGNFGKNPVNTIAISADGEFLISGGSDFAARSWTMVDEYPYINTKETIDLHERVNAASAGILDSGYIFVFGTEEGNLYIADEQDKELEDLYKLSPGFEAIWSVAISNNSDLLAVGTQTGHLLIYDIDEIINSLNGDNEIPHPYIYKISQFTEKAKSRINSLSFSMDDNYLAIGSLNYITIKGFCPPSSEN